MFWKQLLSSERAKNGKIEADLWKVGGGYRYTVLDIETGEYLTGGTNPNYAESKAYLEWVLNGEIVP